mgnify:CR=1 FL=1
MRSEPWRDVRLAPPREQLIDTTPAPRRPRQRRHRQRVRRAAGARPGVPGRPGQAADGALAVDFYRTGELFRVARTLNGLDPAPTAPLSASARRALRKQPA